MRQLHRLPHRVASRANPSAVLTAVGAFAVAAGVYAVTGFAGAGLIVWLVAVSLGVIAVRRPDIGFIAAVVLAATNGSARRILDYVDPGSPASALLPLLPGGLLVFIYITHLRRRSGSTPGAPNRRIDGPVLMLVAAVALAGLSPRGSLTANLSAAGLLIVGILAFTLTRSKAIDARAVVVAVLIGGSLNALAMVHQELLGLTPWDALWVETEGYAAIYVGPGEVRPLGLAASAAESAAFCSALAGAGFAMWRTRRWWPALPLVGLGLYAVLLSGTRTYAILALAAIALSFAIGRKRVIIDSAVAVGLTAVTVAVLSRFAESASTSRGIERILRTFAGTADESTNTLPVHLELVERGLVEGIGSLVGSGASRASVLAQAGQGSTEFDLSNLTLIAGIPGLIAMVWIYGRYFRQFPAALKSIDVAPVFLITVATFGQWLNIGFYGIVPVVWAALGIVYAQEVSGSAMDRDRQRASRGDGGGTQSIHRRVHRGASESSGRTRSPLWHSQYRRLESKSDVAPRPHVLAGSDQADS